MFDRGEVELLCVTHLLTSCKYNDFKYVWPFKSLKALDRSHVYLILCTFKYVIPIFIEFLFGYVF